MTSKICLILTLVGAVLATDRKSAWYQKLNVSCFDILEELNHPGGLIGCASNCLSKLSCDGLNVTKNSCTLYTNLLCCMPSNVSSEVFVALSVASQLKANSNKLLILSGKSERSEILDLNTDQCNQILEETYDTFAEGFGGKIDDSTIIVCQREDGRKCLTIETIDLKPKLLNFELGKVRTRGSSIAFKTKDGQSVLWITGGRNATDATDLFDDSELVSTEGTTQGPKLPYPLRSHCLVKINMTTVLLLGGNNGTAYPRETWFYHTSGTKSKGPMMLNGRVRFGCQTVLHEEEKFVLVVGGYIAGNYIDTVEILDLKNNEWKNGPSFPFRVRHPTMVKSRNQNGEEETLLLGGRNYDLNPSANSDKIFRFECGQMVNQEDCQWMELQRKMQLPRRQSIVIPIR